MPSSAAAHFSSDRPVSTLPPGWPFALQEGQAEGVAEEEREEGEPAPRRQAGRATSQPGIGCGSAVLGAGWGCPAAAQVFARGAAYPCALTALSSLPEAAIRCNTQNPSGHATPCLTPHPHHHPTPPYATPTQHSCLLHLPWCRTRASTQRQPTQPPNPSSPPPLPRPVLQDPRLHPAPAHPGPAGAGAEPGHGGRPTSGRSTGRAGQEVSGGRGSEAVGSWGKAERPLAYNCRREGWGGG